MTEGGDTPSHKSGRAASRLLTGVIASFIEYAARNREETTRYKNVISAISGLRAAIDRIANINRARENQTEKHEKRRQYREYGTIIALAAAAGVAAWGIIQAHIDTNRALRDARTAAVRQHAETDASIAALKEQSGIMRGQLNEMEIARRPWVTADISLTDQITLQDGSISLPTLITLRNTGQTPATRTNITGEAFPIMTMITNHLAESKRICKRSDKAVNMNMTIGPAVFPGEKKRALLYDFGVSRDQIDKYNHTYPAMNGMIHLALLICISYTEYGDAPIHHTSFAIRFLGIKITDLPIPSNGLVPIDLPFLTLPPD